MKTRVLGILISVLCWGQVGFTMADYKNEILSWRTKQEERLRGESGWLTVVGLAWLKEAESSIGSGDNNKVRLPSSAPESLGKLYLSESKMSIKFSTIAGVTLNGESVVKDKSYALVADTEGKATEVKVGTVTFFVVKRKNGIGVRIKDSASVARASFKGRQWYDVNTALKVEATWKPFEKPQKLLIPDVIGNENMEEAPGVAEFQLNGKTYQLTPTWEDQELFFVFRDESCGKESYGAARFLYASAPKDGKVVLDFNKTVNPPCAFTDFATCPLAPRVNHLKTSILAGEKAPLDGAH